ncbi:MAG: kelch repeat-containing protein [Phycisphaeraceae bacterium]
MSMIPLLIALVAAPGDAPLDLARLPANKWVLLHEEDASGGKNFARAIFAPNVQRFYLWGIGGDMPARNVYKRFELEAFDPAEPKWIEAFPAAAAGKWSADSYPPFRILGQNGPDGLKHDEGPRLQVVSGYHATNRVRFWDFDGIPRPSPIHTFNMACWDSKRNRVIYYGDSTTFALDPATNSWIDLKAVNHPIACQVVAWASMCYDSKRDRVLLIGGGLATNPSGAAPTWLYDCAANKWERPKVKTEPPPRCNAALVYDPATQSAVLFGGYDQSAAVNDTWIFDGRTDTWSQRTPVLAPPPMYEPAAALLPGVESKVLVCGYDARKVKLGNQATTSAQKETWVYDIAANSWTPIDASLNLPGYTWMTADASHKDGVVFMTAFGNKRRTYAMRYDTSAAPIERPGAPLGTVAWKYPEQKLSLENAPAPDPATTAKMLENLPVNTMVDAAPPGMLISKTWSTAVLDSDRHEVLYIGGGHSGYSGNDIARYSLATNRWSLDFPPRFPPYLEGTNAGLFGWSYGRMPFSQHTYLWYCYDPQSKTMVYFARPSIPAGIEVQPTDDPESVFVYDPKEHGYTTWVYDPAKKQMLPPDFGRRFANEWHLCAIGTPRGVYVAENNRLHHAKVDRSTGRIAWAVVDDAFPKADEVVKYHYEYQPIVHDTKRDRLIQIKGDGKRVHVFARGFGDSAKWELIVAGDAAIGREAVYIPKHDVILWLGDRLHVYDCASKTMRTLDIVMPKGSYNHECAMVYDEKHDVCVALLPRSFTGPMQTFLFRYRPGK